MARFRKQCNFGNLPPCNSFTIQAFCREHRDAHPSTIRGPLCPILYNFATRRITNAYLVAVIFIILHHLYQVRIRGTSIPANKVVLDPHLIKRMKITRYTKPSPQRFITRNLHFHGGKISSLGKISSPFFAIISARLYRHSAPLLYRVACSGRAIDSRINKLILSIYLKKDPESALPLSLSLCLPSVFIPAHRSPPVRPIVYLSQSSRDGDGSGDRANYRLLRVDTAESTATHTHKSCLIPGRR